jgi:signal transduction histidine kinase
LIFETDFFKTFCIKVKDEGCGIAPENAEIVYLPFRKAPNETMNFSHGNGIGLTITKGIAHTLGAELSFESELEKGTCFSLLFKHKRIVPQS